MDERSLWARRVASLLRRGVPLAEALAAARDETDSFELAGPLALIAERVRGGSSLADAMRDLAGPGDSGSGPPDDFFSVAEVDALERAEKAGDLPEGLDALSARSAR
jgi:type II secretory pathway component PulF